MSIRAADGRIPGRRGLETRARLLDATGDLCATRTYRDVAVLDIARRAETSPATFYQYFPDVESAVLALAEDAEHALADLADVIRAGPWRAAAGMRLAEDIAARFVGHWRAHGAVLRVVDLAAAEGDERFRQVRVRMLNDVVLAFRDVIGGRRAPATATVLVTMLAHVAAHVDGIASWGVREEDLRTSMAEIVFDAVSGQSRSRSR